MESNNYEILSFNIGKETLGIKIDHVKEIIKADYVLTSIPCASSEILGMFSPRDSVIVGIDLQQILYHTNSKAYKLLTTNQNDWTDEEKIMLQGMSFIICNFDGYDSAWLVDGVNDILNFDNTEIVEPNFAMPEGGYVLGIYPHDNQLIQILDFEKIYIGMNIPTIE